MSYKDKPDFPLNDKQIYQDFVADQHRLRQQYAGAGAKNNNSAANYNAMQGFEQFKEQRYDPNSNRYNVFARKQTRQLPKTRDRFISNPLTQLLN